MKAFFNSYIPELLKNRDGFRGAMAILLIALIMLIVEFYGWQVPFLKFMAKDLGFFTPVNNELMFRAQIFTSFSFGLFFFMIPFLFQVFFPLSQEELDGIIPSCGLGGTDLKKAFQLYSPLVIIMLPVLWIACSRESFYQFYPLYKADTLSNFLIYEMIYLTQFFAVEFFFRGFGLFKLEKLMPGYGLFVMVIPYSFVHIHKPFGEALGSIVAGVILGHLALKSRSIWPGVIVHGCIAFSADLFSMIHSGKLAQF